VPDGQLDEVRAPNDRQDHDRVEIPLFNQSEALSSGTCRSSGGLGAA